MNATTLLSERMLERCVSALALTCLLTACSGSEPEAAASNELNRFVRVPIELERPQQLSSQRLFAVASDSLTALVPTKPHIIRRRDGTYVVGSSGDGLLAVHLDSLGSLLRVIGGLGDGPGKYRSISDLAVLSGDTLGVSGAQRLSHFAPDGAYVRRVQSQSVVVLRGGRYNPHGPQSALSQRSLLAFDQLHTVPSIAA